VNLYDAFESIGYIPQGMYVALPAPGPTMGLGEVAEGLMSLSIFESHEPFTTDPVAAEFVARYQEAAAEAEVLPIVETQAAASFSAWQILFASVLATESVDNALLKEYLLANSVATIAGEASFDGFNGYGTDFSRVVQIQDGQRVIVWPPEFAAPDTSVEYPIE
jgi:branched-chain amino acid transport system substrate-binding protein